MKKLFLLVTGTAFAIALSALLPVAALADTPIAHGTFEGASQHVTTGGVSVVTTPGGRTLVILDDDFSLDNGPDPRVGFGNDGSYAPDTELGTLVNLAGLQVYVVPATVDPAAFNEIYIWCKVAGVPLGIATLN